MKKISEKQDDNEKMLSKVIKITDEEMKRSYKKFLIMAFFGFELIIINLICILIVYIANTFSLNMYIMLLLLILVGIVIGVYGLCGIYLHKRKPEKYSKMKDEEIKRNYNKFIAITFFGFISVIITLTFFIYLFFFLIPLGIVLGAYGLYGIYSHKRKPEKYRETREKKLERKISLRLQKKMDRRKISVGLTLFGGVLDLIIGLPTLFGFGLFSWGASSSVRIFIGITFIPSGILAFVGAFIEFKSVFIGGVLCLIAAFLTIFLPLIVNVYYFYYILMMPIFYISTVFIIVGGILGIFGEIKK